MKKNLLKIAALSMALTVAAAPMASFAQVGVPTPPPGYMAITAIDSAEITKGLEVLKNAGIFVGDPDGDLRPLDTLTRAQAAKIIAVATAGKDTDFSKYEQAAKNAFSDLTGAGWAAGYIGYAVGLGIIEGYENGTYKPAGNVTVNEMMALTLRAAGKETKGLKWPEGYAEAAKTAGYLKYMGETANYSNAALRWQAAGILYAAYDDVRAAAEAAKGQIPGEGGENGEKPADTEQNGFKFVKTGEFDENITKFNGVALAGDVKVYTYLNRSDYSAEMSLPSSFSGMIQDTVYKYKNVTTPAWYSVKDGKVTAIVLPTDVGFTGRALCVINEVATMKGAGGDSVPAYVTLTGGREITWLTRESSVSAMPAIADIEQAVKEGWLFELRLRNGQVYEINYTTAAGDEQYAGYCTELGSAGAWAEVEKNDRSGLAIQLLNQGYYGVAKNAAVYILNDEEDGYEAGSLSDISKGDFVRIYDVTEKDDVEGTIILVKQA